MEDLLCALAGPSLWTAQAPQDRSFPCTVQEAGLLQPLDPCSGRGGREAPGMGVEGSSVIQTAQGTTLCRDPDVVRERQEEAGGD